MAKLWVVQNKSEKQWIPKSKNKMAQTLAFGHTSIFGRDINMGLHNTQLALLILICISHGVEIFLKNVTVSCSELLHQIKI